MKLTLQGLKNGQGLQSRFQLRLKSLGFKNAKLQKQRYTLSNYVFASSYSNNQFKNIDEIKRLENLSNCDDREDLYLVNLTYAGIEYPMKLRRYVHMRKGSRPTLRSFMPKSSTERYGVSVFFNFNERKT